MPLSNPSAVFTSGQTQFTTSSFSTGSFSSSNNSLLVAVLNIISGTSTTAGSVSASGGGLTWGNTFDGGTFSGTYGTSGTIIFTAEVITGGSLSLTFAGLSVLGTCYYNCDVYSLTGYNTATPTGANASGTSNAAGAVSITLSSAPASTSCVMAGVSFIPTNNGGNSSVGSGWTSLYDNVGTGGKIEVQQQYRSGSTSTSVSWADQCNGDTIVVAGQWALEVIAAPLTSNFVPAFSFIGIA